MVSSSAISSYDLRTLGGLFLSPIFSVFRFLAFDTTGLANNRFPSASDPTIKEPLEHLDQCAGEAVNRIYEALAGLETMVDFVVLGAAIDTFFRSSCIMLKSRSAVIVIDVSSQGSFDRRRSV